MSPEGPDILSVRRHACGFCRCFSVFCSRFVSSSQGRTLRRPSHVEPPVFPLVMYDDAENPLQRPPLFANNFFCHHREEGQRFHVLGLKMRTSGTGQMMACCLYVIAAALNRERQNTREGVLFSRPWKIINFVWIITIFVCFWGRGAMIEIFPVD